MAVLGINLWFLVVLAGTTLLGLAFAYAVAQFGRHDPRLDPVRDEVTRRNYAVEELEEKLPGAAGMPPVPPPIAPAPEDVRRRSTAA